MELWDPFLPAALKMVDFRLNLHNIGEEWKIIYYIRHSTMTTAVLESANAAVSIRSRLS